MIADVTLHNGNVKIREERIRSLRVFVVVLIGSESPKPIAKMPFLTFSALFYDSSHHVQNCCTISTETSVLLF